MSYLVGSDFGKLWTLDLIRLSIETDVFYHILYSCVFIHQFLSAGWLEGVIRHSPSLTAGNRCFW